MFEVNGFGFRVVGSEGYLFVVEIEGPRERRVHSHRVVAVVDVLRSVLDGNGKGVRYH